MRLAKEAEQVALMGVEVDAVTIKQAIDVIVATASQPESTAMYVVKPYVEFLDRARHDPEIKRLLNGASLCVADGIALIWAASYLYAGPRTTWRLIITLAQIITHPKELLWPLPERFGGTTFAVPLIKAAAARRIRIALVASPKAGTLEETLRGILQFAPEANIVAATAGRDPEATTESVTDAWVDTLVQTLESAQPDLILVGMGFPRQEKVCAELCRRLKHGVCIGEGGTFDYEIFGGKRVKAPRWIERIGLEWLYRLIQEPKRWRRQLAIPRFIYHIWGSR